MLSPNGSEHVLSSCGEENGAKEHLELGHCIDEANMHDDNSLDRRNGRMRFSDFHRFLWLLPSAVFSLPQGCNQRSRFGKTEEGYYVKRKRNHVLLSFAGFFHGVLSIFFLKFGYSFRENIPIKEVFKQLKCTREGLSTEKGEKRLQIFGFNKLDEKKAQLFNSFVS
ncbi:hypothetical protein RHMOL_Rhmol01G0035800 [Rhododendron molle]|uniref:Uncharacterized protein n=1 Tax=Rhododendron molle TaxID=49168 RepID=A0ACC0PY07_RHOML|nr:hypothetical protein RHMOL_Rhmol01G0035800 [Rhododendron molle]